MVLQSRFQYWYFPLMERCGIFVSETLMRFILKILKRNPVLIQGSNRSIDSSTVLPLFSSSAGSFILRCISGYMICSNSSLCSGGMKREGNSWYKNQSIIYNKPGSFSIKSQELIFLQQFQNCSSGPFTLSFKNNVLAPFSLPRIV